MTCECRATWSTNRSATTYLYYVLLIYFQCRLTCAAFHGPESCGATCPVPIGDMQLSAVRPTLDNQILIRSPPRWCSAMHEEPPQRPGFIYFNLVVVIIPSYCGKRRGTIGIGTLLVAAACRKGGRRVLVRAIKAVAAMRRVIQPGAGRQIECQSPFQLLRERHKELCTLQR